MPTTVFTNTLTGGDTTRANENDRMVYTAAVLGAAAGNQVRITLLFHGVTGTPPVFGPCYIGQSAGTAPNFTGDQVQILFGGSGTFNIPGTNPSTVVSDFATLAQAWDNTKSYTVSYFLGPLANSDNLPFQFTAGMDFWSVAGGVGSTADQTVPSPSLSLAFSGLNFLISSIEVQAGGGGAAMLPVGASM